MEIAINQIEVGTRKRQLSIEKVAELAHSITEIGLLNPVTVISVNSHFKLIAGAHRLEAFKLLQLDTIPAHLIDGDELDIELAEIDENLRRNDLTVLEQGEHLVRRDEILAARGLRATASPGTNQYKKVGDNLTPTITTEQIAAEVGIKERTAQRRKSVARKICEQARDNIRDVEDVADNMTQLGMLADMPSEKQIDISEKIKSGETKNVTEAVRPHVSNNSGNNEWYTPVEIIEAARDVMGSIDLDPASCDIANRNVKAATYYTRENDGLTKGWHGRVWMNPPYGRELIDKFTEKLAEHYALGDVTEAIAITNNATETEWFHNLIKQASAIVFPTGRVKYLDERLQPVNAPLQGQAIIYLGKNREKFIDKFSKFGWGVYVRV